MSILSRHRFYWYFACSISILLALNLTRATIIASAPAVPKSTSLTVLYTNQENGQIRSCNCTKFRFGGYGREATFIKQIRASGKTPILVDGGDMIGRVEGEQERLKTQTAFKAIDAIKYSALIPGENEVLYGIGNCRALSPSTSVPFVLANVSDRKTGKPLSPNPYVVCRNGSQRVAIIGLLGQNLIENETMVGIAIEDPMKALTRVSKAVKRSADITLVVSHSTIEDARRLARSGYADIIICTHTSGKVMMPNAGNSSIDAPIEKIGKCLLIESGVRSGWSVGRLDIVFEHGKATASTNCLYYLGRGYSEHPDIVRLYDSYNKRLAELSINQHRELRSQVEASLAKNGIDLAKLRKPKVFAGAEACMKCHPSAYDAWTKSQHAHAFNTLKKTKQEYDPECIECHTLGAATRGGFINAKETPEFANVQCESCHGHGMSHSTQPKGDYRQVSEETCRSCHTDDYNPNFDYKSMWGRIEHK